MDPLECLELLELELLALSKSPGIVVPNCICQVVVIDDPEIFAITQRYGPYPSLTIDYFAHDVEETVVDGEDDMSTLLYVLARRSWLEANLEPSDPQCG